MCIIFLCVWFISWGVKWGVRGYFFFKKYIARAICVDIIYFNTYIIIKYIYNKNKIYKFNYKSPEQRLNLSRSQDKPTLILTIPRSISKSSTKDLSFSVPKRRLNLVLGRSLSLRVNTENGEYRRFPAQILTQRRSVIILQMVASGHWLFNQPHKPIVCTNGSSRTKFEYCRDNNSSVG